MVQRRWLRLQFMTASPDVKPGTNGAHTWLKITQVETGLIIDSLSLSLSTVDTSGYIG